MSWTARSQQVRYGVREVVLIVAAALLYSLVRGLTDDRVNVAYDNAERVISWQRSLGIFVEPDVQSWVAGSDAAVNAINAVYIAGYWPVLIGSLAWLLIRHPDRYPLFRNALLASGAITLVIFTLFPLAPPRFLPEHGFVDTVSENSQAYREFSASPFVNEYAAMPSLHFGWVLLLGIAWIWVARSTVAMVCGVTMPSLMFAAIILTGNHYILDGVVGAVVVLSGLAIAVGIERRSRRRTEDASDGGPWPGGYSIAEHRPGDHDGDGTHRDERAPVADTAASDTATVVSPRDSRERLTLPR